MIDDDVAFSVTGREAEGPGWEQQQACEEEQQHEASLSEIIQRIDHHLRRIEWAWRELLHLQDVFSPAEMHIGHSLMQGGHDHEPQ
jgi:hypothetical protein